MKQITLFANYMKLLYSIEWWAFRHHLYANFDWKLNINWWKLIFRWRLHSNSHWKSRIIIWCMLIPPPNLVRKNGIVLLQVYSNVLIIVEKYKVMYKYSILNACCYFKIKEKRKRIVIFLQWGWYKKIFATFPNSSASCNIDVNF